MSKFKYPSSIEGDYNRRKEILKDFETVCNSQIISKQAVYDMAWRTSWEWTDNTGAYVGCPYWTEDALKLLFDDFDSLNINKYINRKALSKNVDGKVTHEHIVPRNYFTNYIISCYEKKETPTIENLNKMAACIVTKDEDKILSNHGYKQVMPDNINTLESVQNPWQRYINSGITRIYKINWDNSVIKGIDILNIEKS